MEEEVQNQEKTSKKSNVLIIAIVGILAFLLILIIAVLGFMMVSSPNDEAQPMQAATTAKTTKTTMAPGQRGSDFVNIGQMFALEPFTLNLLSEGGRSYVKCTIQLEQNSELLTPELEKKIPIIRDIIIATLASKTFEEVSTTKGKERLKDELVGKINEVLTDGFIKNIYFMDFVIS